jgi:hypothetical protein
MSNSEDRRRSKFSAALLAAAIVLGSPGVSWSDGSGGYSSLRYDIDYPTIGYSRTPVRNEIARLQKQIDRGEVKLEFKPPRGYLDSVLATLRIDPSSQVLVFSKTSLQIDGISGATPRAIYFNDDTYVAWIPNVPLLEIATMDSDLGAVFYAIQNTEGGSARIERETSRCLSCHDTFSMSGGGVPRFMLVSAIVGVDGTLMPNGWSRETNDRTPIRDRWGGWYVTGEHGSMVHLGNLQLRASNPPADLDLVRRGNLKTVAGLFDTTRYLTDKSDIVALLVLEHQLYVKNLITRANYKARTFVAREAGGDDDVKWDELSPKTRQLITRMSEQLVQAMLFVGAAPLTDKVTGNAGFEEKFQALGPRDSQGRSLRDLDLQTRLFKYPLSYVVYSEGFDALPDYVRGYVYKRFAEILTGRDRSHTFAHLSEADRTAVREILAATKPGFAQVLRSAR